MSKVARRKQLLTATPAMSMPAIAADGPATPYAAPPPASLPPLHTPDGRAVRVVHIVAELAPFARSGGLGEAVNSLARFQSARGVPTSIVMPLYDIARANVAGHRAGRAGVQRPGRSAQRASAAVAARRSRRSSARVDRRLLRRERGVLQPAGDLWPAGLGLSRQRAPVRVLHDGGAPGAADDRRRRAGADSRARLAYGARAGVSAHDARRRRAVSAREDRALGAQRRLPGAFPAGGDGRPRPRARRCTTGASSSGTAG